MDDPTLSEEEINGLIDGELSEAERAEVQARLALNPTLAAEVFAEAHRMEALRSSQPQRLFPPKKTIQGARQLEAAFRRRRTRAVFRQGVAAALLLAAGWTSNLLIGSIWKGGQTVDDDFILAARESLRVAQLNTGIKETGGNKEDKIDQLAATLNISVPQLPSTWTVRDVQVQSWNERQSLVITASTQALGQVTLLAAPMNGEGAVPLTSAEDGRVPTVYWQSGGTAYALMGPAAPDRLEKEAKGIEVATRRNTWPKIRG